MRARKGVTGRQRHADPGGGPRRRVGHEGREQELAHKALEGGQLEQGRGGRADQARRRAVADRVVHRVVVAHPLLPRGGVGRRQILRHRHRADPQRAPGDGPDGTKRAADAAADHRRAHDGDRVAKAIARLVPEAARRRRLRVRIVGERLPVQGPQTLARHVGGAGGDAAEETGLLGRRWRGRCRRGRLIVGRFVHRRKRRVRNRRGLDRGGLRWRGLRWRGLRWRGLRWRGLRWRGLRWRGLRWRGLRWRWRCGCLERHRLIVGRIVHHRQSWRGLNRRGLNRGWRWRRNRLIVRRFVHRGQAEQTGEVTSVWHQALWVLLGFMKPL